MATTQLKIAIELLDQAIRLYYDGGVDFAALHLAGAAEELLGRQLERIGQTTAFTSLRDAAVQISANLDDEGPATQKQVADAMNYAKNHTKHGLDGASPSATFDARAEAEDMIDRALTNFYALANRVPLSETERIRRFNADIVRRTES